MSPPVVSGPANSLLEGNTLRAIARLAAPTTGVMLVGATSNVLLTFFVSRLGAEAIAALSLVFPISLIMITLIAGGIGPGISSAVARTLGAGRPDEAKSVAEHAFLLTAVLAVVFTCGLETGARAIFTVLGGTGEVLHQATLFARILFAGLVLMFFSATLDSIMRGEGNVRVPAVAGALALGLQTILAPVLMFVIGWGLAGAPLATLAGQVVGVSLRARHVFGGHGAVRPGFVPRVFERRHIAEILSVGVPSSLTAMVNYIGMMVITGIVARFGTAHLAAFGLGTRLGFVLFTLGYGVATAALTLVGMAFGAGRPKLVPRITWQAVVSVSLAVLVPTGVVVWQPQLWFGLFTADVAILAVGREYLQIVGPSYVFAVAAMVLGSCFQALRQAGRPLAVACIRVTLVLSTAIVLTRVLGYGVTEVFVVVSVGAVCATGLLAWLFHRATRHLNADVPACTTQDTCSE